MTAFELATLATSVVIGLGQIGIVWYGIHAMTRATERRAAEARDEARRASQAADQRHAETMQALDVQRQAFREQGDAFHKQGEAFREQGEAFREQGAALREQGAALREQTSALAVLVARTAPAAD